MTAEHKLRSSGEPAASTARKIEIIIELIRARRVSIVGIQRRFRISERQATRDLQELRAVGSDLGFEIGRRNSQGNVELGAFHGRSEKFDGAEQSLQSAIAQIFKAFGEPLRGLVSAEHGRAEQASFLQFVMPKLSRGSDIATLLAALGDAWEAHARVGFIYHDVEREVEPAACVVRSGRYYLVGRQLGGKAGWRVFSLDEIVGAVHRCGTFVPKQPPEEYLSGDTVGWIKTGKQYRVEVMVAPRLANTAVSRLWQSAQQVRHNVDGTVTLTFTVGDPDEVIRWSLGFGDEAWISGPSTVVKRAREVVAAISERYR